MSEGARDQGIGNSLRASSQPLTHDCAMVTPSSKSPPTGYPEYAVRRETISRYFEPPLPRSTFHDFVNKGVIIPMKGIRGFYLLNASLRRLGLREVPKLPEEPATRSLEKIVRLAFSLIDPELFPPPSWLLTVEELDPKDADHARLLADQHREAVTALDCAELKVAYLGGVLDAQVMLAEGVKSGRE